MDIAGFQQMRKALSNLVSKIQAFQSKQPPQSNQSQTNPNPQSSFNPMIMIKDQQTEMQFKRAVFQWMATSDEVIKELQEKKAKLRKKQIEQRWLV